VPDSSNDQHKHALLGALVKAEASAGALQQRLQEGAADAGRARSVAQRFIPLVEQVPNDEAWPQDVWQDLTTAWQAQDRSATSTFALVGDLSSSATTAAVTLTTTASTAMIGGYVPRPEDVKALRSLLHRPSLFEQIRSSAYAFGLTGSTGGSRSAMDLLNEAAQALAQSSPTAPAITSVLIPAREAINTALAELLRRRPKQEGTGRASAKVESIGRQCGRSGLATDHFERMGRDLDRLLDRLSDGKSRSLTPPQVSDLFDDVLQFLVAVLGSLDPMKLAAR